MDAWISQAQIAAKISWLDSITHADCELQLQLLLQFGPDEMDLRLGKRETRNSRLETRDVVACPKPVAKMLQFNLLITGGYMIWKSNPLAAIMAAITVPAPAPAPAAVAVAVAPDV